MQKRSGYRILCRNGSVCLSVKLYDGDSALVKEEVLE